MQADKLQRTDEWHQARKYRFTSSSIYKLLTEPRSKAAKDAGELSETSKSYILEKIVQEVGGYLPEFSSKATEWGNEHEDDAAYWYQVKTSNRLGEIQFCEVNEFYGGSPDRAVIDTRLCDPLDQDTVNGALEIKCPYNSVNHLQHCLIDSAETFKAKHPDYYWQCMSHMITLNVDWCDFVSFDPRIDHPIGLFIFRLERNQDDAELLLSKLEAANAYKMDLKIQLGLL
jgi:hypothetical protein